MAKSIFKSEPLNPMEPSSADLDAAIRAEMELTAGCLKIRFLVERGYLSMARENLEDIFSKGHPIENLQSPLAESALALLQAYEKSEQHRTAIDFFKQYEGILGDNPIALTLTGTSCLQLNDSQQAESFLEKAIQKDITCPDPYLLWIASV